MSKGRMPQVMHQRQSLHQISIQSKLRRNRARNLRDFDGMRQAGAEVVGVAAGEDLCLVLEAAKGARVDDAEILPVLPRGFRGPAS